MRGKTVQYAVIAALAGFLFGFDTAVISGAEQTVQRVWEMDAVLHGLAISSALWGTVIGALFGGWPSDKYGRKPTLIVIGILYAVSAIGSALAWDPYSFMIFRLIGGLGVGASSVAAPAYIAEIAPAAQRGRLVALFQTNIVIGILVAFVSNYLLGGIGDNDWRWMLGAEVLPAIAYLAACFIIPESPRWLVTRRGDVAGARAVLMQTDPDGAEATLAAIAAGEGEEQRMSLKAFFSAKYRRVIGLAVAIAFFNQVSGINAIIYYAPRIFESAGQGQSAALLATTGIGVVNLITTIVGMLLIDKMGRRWLMTVGSFGYIGSLLMVAYGFWSAQFALVPIFIFAFIAAHAIGQGAVIWVFISEIFPNEARAQGQALGASTHWVLAAALTLVMPAVLESVPPVAIFLSFAAMMAVQLVWVRAIMPETKGRSLEDLSRA